VPMTDDDRTIRQAMEASGQQLGRTGLVTPACAFGGIPVGRDHLSDEEASDVVRRAVDSGLTLIDTFSAYGRSEIRIGAALESRREKVILVTKSRSAMSPVDFETMVETSLRNLRTDRIDVLLLKNVDNDASLANVPALIPVFEKLRQQGKALFLGLSSHSPAHACAAIEGGGIDVAEVPWNYANRHFEPVLDLAAQQNVGILAMKPLGGGRLFPEGEKGGAQTLSTLVNALSFALSHACRPVLIPGIGSESELDRYLEAIPRLQRLTPEQMDALTEQASLLGNDFCRACGYCRSVCPAGMPIDEILPLLDRVEHIQTDATFALMLRRQFAALSIPEGGCRECGKCLEECPFDLKIIDRLKVAFDALVE